MAINDSTKKPTSNILLIVLDQLRADVLNGPLAASAPTPNLDQFAAESATFQNHFTVTVPCGPARASLLTGDYAMNHGVRLNGLPLSADYPNLATLARTVGYEPLLFGYTDTQQDNRTKHPNDPDLRSFENVLPGFREVVEMRLETAREWPAYLKAQGVSLPEEWPADWKSLYRPLDGKLGNPALYPAEHSDTAYLTKQLIQALSVRSLDGPWFAHAAYLRPHPPLLAPDPWHRLVDPAGLAPAIPSGDMNHFQRAWRSEPTQKGLFWGFDGEFDSLSLDDEALLRAAYLGLLAEVDAHLGRVFEWLKESGQWDNTLIVLTSDHGEMLGDHGLWGKQGIYDSAYHIPLMIRVPGEPGGRRFDRFTESVDVLPTLLDWMGVEGPAHLPGQSLLSILRGHSSNSEREGVLLEVELSGLKQPSRFERYYGLPAEQAHAVVWRDHQWKYVHFNGGLPPLLFDLQNDPQERTNRGDDPAFQGIRSLCQDQLMNHLLRYRRPLRR